jgi:hypothetical protein
MYLSHLFVCVKGFFGAKKEPELLQDSWRSASDSIKKARTRFRIVTWIQIRIKAGKGYTAK